MVERIIEITDDKYHYSSGYYTVNKWIDKENVVLARSEKQTIGAADVPRDDKTELVKCNVYTGEKEVLCNDVMAYQEYLVYKNLLYYVDGERLIRINLDTKEREVIFEKKGICCPHITNDGKVISFYIESENGGVYTMEARDNLKERPVEFLAIDVESGNELYSFKKSFEKPLNWAAHGMVCPENPDLMFFCHEGNTFYVSNRLWLYDNKTKNQWNIAKQRLDDDGNLGDCYGHEMWAPDGKGLYFVKYICSPKPPRGICYVDVQTGKAELLYSAFNYWHVGVSSDGNYLTSDTQTGKDYSEVILINRKTGEETLIDSAKTDWMHPCHPHPQISPDNKKIMYTALTDKGRTCVKIALLK